MSFESMPGVDLDVTNFAARVLETGGMGPQTVLEEAQDWQIEVEWEAVGTAVDSIHGKWIVDAYVESIGPGDELHIGQKKIDMAGAGPYLINLIVAAATVNVAAGQKTTPYKLVTTLTAEDHAGHRYPMAGYIEGPVLQFYQKG